MEDELQKVLGRRLSAIRETQGKNPEAFADELGFHLPIWAASKRGERYRSLKSVESLADRLGISALKLHGPCDRLPAYESPTKEISARRWGVFPL